MPVWPTGTTTFALRWTVAVLIRTVFIDFEPEQTCYFNIKNNDKLLNTFLSKRTINSVLKKMKFIFKLNNYKVGAKTVKYLMELQN